MCSDSEQQIAKMEWLFQHRMHADPREIEAPKEMIQTLKDLHASLKEAYEAVSGKKFESKRSAYQKRLGQKLSN